ncbi:MAG: lipocalin-like domain-containing protein [Pelovirga sp.]
MRVILVLRWLLLGGLAVALCGCQDGPTGATAERAELTVAAALGTGEDTGFARATTPRAFVFPADHGPHPEFKTEWWYYTGHLHTAAGRRFGYQLTFFRIALRPDRTERSSDWAATQLYMAHFALTDPAAAQFHYFERFSRAALGLAGATAHPFRVWLEDWTVVGAADNSLPMGLVAAADGIAIDLQLDSAKPVVLQGDAGLSQKSAEPGNASYYYSLTRMPTAGAIRIADETFAVTGDSWLDREWSTSALGEDQVGWDWFSLQLTDGRELMYYQLRRSDGSADPFSGGVLVAADGTSERLRSTDVTLAVQSDWQSPHGGRYPARWRLRLPAHGLDLDIKPLLADQELRTTVRYWEGAVGVQGRSDGEEIGGRGYVELTGYAQ